MRRNKLAQVAPGLPSMENLGRAEELRTGLAPWVIQHHKAQRAGPHYDIRIGNPYGMLMSWASRYLPSPGEKRLAIQQPLHEGQYADFEGELTSRYGKGTVKKHDRGQVLITEVRPDLIKFVVAHKKQPEQYVLKKVGKMGSKAWLMINTTPSEVIENQKVHYRKVPAEDVEKLFSKDYLASEKIDGASALINLLGDEIQVLSYRTTKEGKPIHHTMRIAGGPIKAKVPKELKGKVLRGEIYGSRGGKAIPPQELGGILNSSLARALSTKGATGTDLKVALFDILGDEDRPYPERLEVLKKIVPNLPNDIFHLPEVAETPEQMQEMWNRIKSGQQPLTEEGMVFHNRKGGKPIKVKIRPERDVWVKQIVPGKDGAAAFEYSTSPGGPIVGRVGSGFGPTARREMLEDPESWVGRMARIQSQGQFPSGAHRSPAFIALHEDYPAVDDEDEDKKKTASAFISLGNLYSLHIAKGSNRL